MRKGSLSVHIACHPYARTCSVCITSLRLQGSGHDSISMCCKLLLLCTGVALNSRATSLLLPEATPATALTSAPAPAQPLPSAAATASEAAAEPAGGLSQPSQTHAQAASVTAGLQALNTAGAFPQSTHMQTDSMHLPASSSPAAPSIISAVTQVDGANVGANAKPTMHSLLEEGHVFMPAMPAELQAELASSASSSFSGIATFGVMQQQLSSTFDSSAVLAGDLAADMLSSPRFAVTDQDMNGGASAADKAAVASVAANAAVSGQMSPGMNTTAFNAAAGLFAVLPPSDNTAACVCVCHPLMYRLMYRLMCDCSPPM